MGAGTGKERDSEFMEETTAVMYDDCEGTAYSMECPLLAGVETTENDVNEALQCSTVFREGEPQLVEASMNVMGRPLLKIPLGFDGSPTLNIYIYIYRESYMTGTAMKYCR